jgi:hypothetical protein
MFPDPRVPACGDSPPGQGALGGHSARVFVVVVSAWLAAPSQIADHHHVFLGGCYGVVVGFSLGGLGVLGGYTSP